MKSHEYAVSAKDMGRVAGSVLMPAVVLAVILRLSASLGLMPSPWPAADLEHTVLTHQALASQATHSADTLFIGDSSCLMGVAAGQLAEYTGGRLQGRNLASFMYVGFEGYARMLARYAAANPGKLERVVLLAHPEMLRGIEPVSHYTDFIASLYAGEDFADKGSAADQARGFFGLNVVQSRFLGRLPQALPGEYGRFYGFNLNLDAYMTRHAGSATDPHHYRPGPAQGNAEYRYSASLEASCKAFRAVVPDGAKLIVAVTPIPESFAPRHYTNVATQVLTNWARGIEADAVLLDLPFVMPDAAFASTTHLNESGARDFTRALAKRLQGL